MTTRKPKLPLVTLRASSAGKCLRQIVLGVLEPDYGKPELEWELFLRRGHTDQVAILSYLVQFGGLQIFTEEEERVKEFEGSYILSGHTDAIAAAPLTLFVPIVIEIKALKENNFLKISGDPASWKKLYPHYLGQVTAYLDLWPKCFSAALIFENRNTADLVGGIQLVDSLPNYTYHPELHVARNGNRTKTLRAKLCRAVEWIQKKEVPECDSESFCWFCSGRRGGMRTKHGGVAWKKTELQEMIKKTQETVSGLE